MLPKSEFDQTECLESLVGIRTGCSVDKKYPFWIEDIEGVDVRKLAEIAKGSNQTGVDFAKQIINSAARELLADIEVLLNNGFSLKNIAGDMCSSCSILPSYTANSGVIVKTAISSRYQMLQITKLNILANVTGTKVLRIHDGKVATDYNVVLEAGVLMPVDLNYITDQKSVKIYFVDNTIPLGLVSCSTSNSCGCGGSAKSNNPITITGLLAGVETTAQYGFLPCAAVTCSYDALVCNLIKMTPNIFGLALFFKVGEKYLLHKSASDRNNEAVSYNEDEKSELVRNYGSLYVSKVYGKNDRKAIKNILNDYLRNNKDACVVCNSRIMTAYVTG